VWSVAQVMPALTGYLLSVIMSASSSSGDSAFATLGRVTLELIAIFAAGAFFSFWRCVSVCTTSCTSQPATAVDHVSRAQGLT
jgi:hypothetical protein